MNKGIENLFGGKEGLKKANLRIFEKDTKDYVRLRVRSSKYDISREVYEKISK
ncbi:MAG: hypothetical protein KC516_01195 [Nanoarchaeota archaeon]|nr:hypothetical protein [Nanoarchaeota archaeon]